VLGIIFADVRYFKPTPNFKKSKLETKCSAGIKNSPAKEAHGLETKAPSSDSVPFST
jgi:hypothetical protein